MRYTVQVQKKAMRYTVQVRKRVRYDYAEEWSAWEDVCTYSNHPDAEDSMATFQRINSGRQYRIIPELPVHAIDCAVAINSRHACSCGAGDNVEENDYDQTLPDQP